jgi:DNA-binding SARP family transcriptional activator
MPLRVKLLGGLSVASNGVVLHELVRQPQRCALLIYLALERSVSRQLALATLWPDASEERGRHVLSQTLYQLRTSLGQDIVQGNGERLEIAAEVSTDAADFAALLARGDSSAALSLYDGNLLEGVRLVDAVPFENWVDGQRARLTLLHRKARRAELEACSARGDWQSALQCARDWVRVDPQEDEAQHRLIELLTRHGSRAEALEQYDLYVRSLRELDLEPLPETIALAEQLRAPQDRRQPSAPPPPIERRSLSPLVDLIGKPSAGRQIIGLYLAAAWFIIQFAATVFPLLGFPSWATIAVALAGSGFPVAIYFAWRATATTENRLVRARMRPGFVHASVAAAVILGSTGLFTRFALWRDASPEVVMILPFRVISSNPTLKPFREGMVDYLATNGINGDAGLHAVAPTRLLNAWRQEGGTDVNDLTPKQQARLARRLQASMILTGEIVETPNQVTLQATLIDARSLTRRASPRVSGPIDSLTVLIDRLAAQLLGEALGQEPERVATFGTVPLQAVTAYLNGVKRSRAGDYNGAVDNFERALSIEPKFALAALMMIDPAGWSARGMGRAEQIAYENRERLSERDQAYLFSWLGTDWPAFTPKSAIDGGLRHIQIAPDMPEAWYTLGDRFEHMGVATGYANPDAEGERYFRKAVELDPSYHAPLEHLIEYSHVKGDTASVRKWINLYFRSNLITDRSYYVLWRAANALGDTRRLDSLRAVLDSASNPALGTMEKESQRGGFGYDDAERALQVFVARATSPAEIHRKTARAEMFYLNAGKPETALAALRQRFVNRPDAPGFAIAALAYATFGEAGIERDTTVLRALQIARGLLATGVANTPGERSASMLGYVAAYHAKFGSLDTARIAVRQLSDVASGSVDDQQRKALELNVRALNWLIALREGAVDGGEVNRFGELVAAQRFVPDEVRLILGELYLRIGDYEKADRQVAPAWAVNGYMAARLQIQARASRQAGKQAAAVKYYSHLLSMRAKAEPALDSWKARIQTEYRQVSNGGI